MTVLLADDARLKELNSSFRHKNKPTDVLSFPAFDNEEGMAGDLAISLETAQRQADEHGHTLEDEVRILILHGVLHLAGYDHEVDKGEMHALEAELRETLKLPVGLIERTLAVPKKKVPAKKSAAKQTSARKASPKKSVATRSGAKKTATRKTR